MLIAMRESKAVRKSVLHKIRELESKQSFQIPQTLGEALQLAADQAKQLELAAPKIAFVDSFVESAGNKTFRQVAKMLSANERLFRAFLVSEGFMYKIGGEWTAYQNHIAAGRFSCKVGEKNGHAFTECKFTPKGIEHIAGKWILAGNT
jgi:phage antirepressor YoqD-like protein